MGPTPCSFTLMHFTRSKSCSIFWNVWNQSLRNKILHRECIQIISYVICNWKKWHQIESKVFELSTCFCGWWGLVTWFWAEWICWFQIWHSVFFLFKFDLCWITEKCNTFMNISLSIQVHNSALQQLLDLKHSFVPMEV